MAKKNPAEFVQEVRAEANKVTWPSRRETTITSAMVLVMIVLASIFFLAVDFALSWGVDRILFGFKR